MKFLNEIDGADKLITDANNRLVKDTDINNWNNKSDKGHKHTKNEITDFPVSLPANGGNADTVNGKTVESNVPPNAKFTDTTYSEISTSEIDAGTSSTLRTISGRRVKYILDKVQGWIGNLTKADVGLNNVDNVKQATKVEFDEHLADGATISKLGHVYHATLTTTLDTTWTGSSAPYSKDVTVNGIIADDNPVIDIIMSGTFATDEKRLQNWGLIYRVVTSTNKVSFYAMDKPNVSLPVQIKVVR